MTTVPGSDAAPVWSDPSWRDAAQAWIEENVGACGQLNVVSLKLDSAVASTKTPTGRMWLKEVAPAFRTEVDLTCALAGHVPGALPEVVARTNHRFLARDAGKPLSKVVRGGGASAAIWRHMVAQYAELQIALIPVASELPAFDARPDSLVQDLAEDVRPLLERLGNVLPFSICHLSLAGNVFVRDEQAVFIDWNTAAYGHPLCGLHLVLRRLVTDYGATISGPDVLGVRDAYLEPWTIYAPMAELRTIFGAANALGVLARVRRHQHILDVFPPANDGGRAAKAAKMLKTFRALLDDPDQIGL